MHLDFNFSFCSFFLFFLHLWFWSIWEKGHGNGYRGPGSKGRVGLGKESIGDSQSRDFCRKKPAPIIIQGFSERHPLRSSPPNRPVLESGGWRDTTYPLFFVFFCPRANLVYIHTIIFPSNVHPSSPTVLFLSLVTGRPVFRAAPERDAFEGNGGGGGLLS